MAVPITIDGYFLVLTFLISLGIQGCGFAIAYTLQFDKITDFTGSLNFFTIGIVTLFIHFAWDPHYFYARNVLASTFLMLWSFRLGGFLLFRVLKTGSDNRFDEMRSQFFKFMGFWVFQLLWAWTVSMPVTFINSPYISAPEHGGGNAPFGSASDIIGIIFFVVGFLFEAISDVQKYRFKSQKPPKEAVNDKGLWGWSRHPNYWGEIVLHWGIWLVTIQPAFTNRVSNRGQSALLAGVVGPLFITLLLFFVSGLPTAEKPVQKRYYLLQYGPKSVEGHPWANYQDYLRSTSLFWPIPPAIYRLLPNWVKTTILLDFPMFQFNAEKDGSEAIAEERKKNQS